MAVKTDEIMDEFLNLDLD